MRPAVPGRWRQGGGTRGSPARKEAGRSKKEAGSSGLLGNTLVNSNFPGQRVHNRQGGSNWSLTGMTPIAND